ncbi:MAG: dephospho-CoA kinase [Verrucomicrobiota bacterium]
MIAGPEKSNHGSFARKLALTGSMGAGKSTVLDLFDRAGWLTMDSDRVVRGLLERDRETQEELRVRWGNDVLLNNGSANRAEIGKIVFGDEAELKWLEALLHPKVRHCWMGLLEKSGDDPVIIEIPLLFEKNLQTYFDASICLSISLQVQLRRLAQRGVDEESARKRISRQFPTEIKVKRADRVLSNDGSVEFLKAQVRELIGQP